MIETLAPIPPEAAVARLDHRTPWLPPKFGYDRRTPTARLVLAEPGFQAGSYTGSPHYGQEQQGHG